MSSITYCGDNQDIIVPVCVIRQKFANREGCNRIFPETEVIISGLRADLYFRDIQNFFF